MLNIYKKIPPGGGISFVDRRSMFLCFVLVSGQAQSRHTFFEAVEICVQFC